MRKLSIVFIFLVIFSGFISAGYDFSKIKQNVSEFTISNGLKFILLEDHSVPIASFVTYVNAGTSDERIGIWGISHFLEHMAFKGTPEVGTNNYTAEKEVLEKMDALFDQILTEKDSLNLDNEKIKKMEAELDTLGEKASTYVVNDELDTILKENGVQNINAGTGADSTSYFYSLPSNRLELWAYLESSRFTDPVFREFYKERGVIKEERRMRFENQPMGKLYDDVLSISFKDHPYHTMGIGPMSNLERITRADMYSYFRANYSAKNIVIGVTGDIYPDQLKKIAEKYFSKLKPGKRNPRVFTTEPPQVGEKTVTIYEDSQPMLIMAFHCPSQSDGDFIKFRVLDNILTTGRSSRLEKKMTIKDKSAMALGSLAGMPGSKYPGLYFIFAIPNSGHTNTELIDVIESEIEKIKKESVTEEELESAKTRLKVSLINGMHSNMGLVMKMLSSEILLGSWTKVFDDIQAVEKITANDIRELVKKYLTRSNRTIGRLEKKEEASK